MEKIIFSNKKRFVSKIIILVLLLSFTFTYFYFCSYTYAESNNDFSNSVNLYELEYCEDLISDKIGEEFIITNYSMLYGLNEKDNYLAVYDENLGYYAIYNRDAGILMERGIRNNPYDGYENNKCYYGGYNLYFYEQDNNIIDILTENCYDKNELIELNFEQATEIEQKCYEISNFNNRNEIVNFMQSQTNQIMLLNSNTQKVDLTTLLYSMALSNSLYLYSRDSEYYGNYCFINDNSNIELIGFQEFMRYNGDTYYDTIIPVNNDGMCGEVAAVILLQYYERLGILNTVPDEIYNKAVNEIVKYRRYEDSEIVSEILKDKLHSFHDEVLGGSTYVSIKDAINKYFDEYNIEGISASSSITTYNIKNAIDNSDPCIVFTSNATLKLLSHDNTNFVDVDASMHAMFCYGYTTNNLGLLDELICHSGWVYQKNCFEGFGYISSVSVVGNVRLLH